MGYKILGEAKNFTEQATQTATKTGYNIIGKAVDFLETAPDPVQMLQETGQEMGQAAIELYNTITDENFGTAQAKAFTRNLINPSSDFDESLLSDVDKQTLTEAVRSARKNKRSYFKYGDFGTTDAETLKGSLLDSFSDPKQRMAHFVGSGGKITQDEEGNTIVEDTYDFNPGPRRKAFWEGLTKGTLDTSAVKGASAIELLSMLGYAAQEFRRQQGKQAETKIRINLGKID